MEKNKARETLASAGRQERAGDDQRHGRRKTRQPEDRPRPRADRRKPLVLAAINKDGQRERQQYRGPDPGRDVD